MKFSCKILSSIILVALIVSGCSVMLPTDSDMPIETSTSSPTNTATNMPTYTKTLDPTSTYTPSPTATPVGGGSGSLLFVGSSGIFPDHSQSIYSYDLLKQGAQKILDGYNLEDVSPNGTQMLVSKLDYSTWMGKGSLYIADVEGTHLEEISIDFHEISLGGKSAAWIEGEDLIIFRKEVNGVIQLFTMNSLGEIQQLTQSSVGVLNFDPVLVGGMLLWEEGYATRHDSRMYGYKLTDLHNQETITLSDWIPDLPIDARNILLSPSREYIAFEVWREEIMYYIADVNFSNVYELKVEDLLKDTSSDMTNVLSSEGKYWLPDGQGLLLSIVSCNPICFLTNLIVLTNNGEVQYEFDLQELNNIGNFLWSPDGKIMIGSSFSRSAEDVLFSRYLKYDYLSGFEELFRNEGVPEERLSKLHWVP